MKVGINLMAFLPGVSGGIEFYIRNLLISLAQLDTENEYYLFTNRDNHHTFAFNQANFHRVRSDVGARPQVARIAWEQVYLPVMASKLRLDVLHSPSYTWPVLSKVPGVVTICDMLYKVYPESIGEPKLTFWRLFVPWSAKRCRKVLTISEHSKQDIVRHFHITPERVVVTPLALDKQLDSLRQPTEQEIAQACVKYGVRRPYILNVGGVGRHKNPISLVRALDALHRRPATKTLALVIAGNDYGAKKEIESAVAALDLGEFVCLPGYVAREDLPALYAGALAYASPSYFEGFGLTLLEAMAYGTPVVTSDRSSLPEVAGDAAFIVNPDDLNQLTDALYQLASNSQCREEMIWRGFRRVEAFSWERTARLTLEAYRGAAGRE